MAGEYQKDVKFDEVQVGDLILIEIFDEAGNFMGDRRGIAKEELDGLWYFEGTSPIYRDAKGFRMFKVTDLSTPKTVTVETAELERLRAIEQRIKDRIVYRGKSRQGALNMKQKARDQWQIEDVLKWDKYAQDYQTDINVLEELLGDS